MQLSLRLWWRLLSQLRSHYSSFVLRRFQADTAGICQQICQQIQSAAPNRSMSKDDSQCCARQTKTQRNARQDCYSEPVRPIKPIRYDVIAMASPDSWLAHRAPLPHRRPAADNPALQRRTHTHRRSLQKVRRPLGPQDLKSHSTARPSPGSI